MKFFLALIFVSTLAHAEGVITYGGGSVQRDFHTMTQGLLQDIEMIPAPIFPLSGSREDIRKAFEATQVSFSEERLFWQGAEVLAINSPFTTPRTLLVSIPKWQELVSQPMVLNGILIHEMLHLAQYDDSSYNLSQMLYEGIEKLYRGDITSAIMAFYAHDRGFIKKLSAGLEELYQNYPNDYRLADVVVLRREDIRAEDVPAWLDIISRYMKMVGPAACDASSIKGLRQDLSKVDGDIFLTKISVIVSDWHKLNCSSH